VSVTGRRAIFAETAELIVKVKEPQAAERAMLRKGQVLFTYLHLAPIRRRPRSAEVGRTAIAYETVTDPRRRPAAAGADVRGGRAAVDRRRGGRCRRPMAAGVLLGGVPGVRRRMWCWAAASSARNAAHGGGMGAMSRCSTARSRAAPLDDAVRAA
jgi:alanine dehydrogenase